MANAPAARPVLRKKKSHVRRNILIVVFAILASVVVVVSSPPVLFFNVTLSGSANPSVPGASISNVTFVDENGVPYAAPVSPAGTYSISLMNGHTYSVYVVYTLPERTAADNCSAGAITLYTLGFSQAYDAAC